MKKFIVMGLLTAATSFLFGQKAINSIINAKETERIERMLASDEMQGRKVYSPELDKAADFIAGEFKAIGLKTYENSNSYKQEFYMLSPKQTAFSATINGEAADEKNILVISGKAELNIDERSGYEVKYIKAGESIFTKASEYIQSKNNLLVMVDESFAKNFSRMSFFRRNLFKSEFNTIFILGSAAPEKFSIQLKQDIKEQKLANVVGVLPGKGKKEEYVIFSGHYDHLGVGRPVDGDSIFNGANDDAAGTTAVILLARYFKALGNNERTLVFAAFTAEESGGFGSKYFSQQFDPNKVVAMFNIEMIGTESKWGKNSAYITGYEKTDMGAILQKNLAGTGFTFHPDPYPDQQLFYRSDNATLARQGVPAHTISTSKMDSEPNYHKVSDEVSTLDMDNMAMIIKSIALSAKTIISGKDTPARVKTDELR